MVWCMTKISYYIVLLKKHVILVEFKCVMAT